MTVTADPTRVVVLDGGLSTALEEQGADLSGSLWTARLLAEEPRRIADAHRAFFDAGAQVATTATTRPASTASWPPGSISTTPAR